LQGAFGSLAIAAPVIRIENSCAAPIIVTLWSAAACRRCRPFRLAGTCCNFAQRSTNWARHASPTAPEQAPTLETAAASRRTPHGSRRCERSMNGQDEAKHLRRAWRAMPPRNRRRMAIRLEWQSVAALRLYCVETSARHS